MAIQELDDRAACTHAWEANEERDSEDEAPVDEVYSSEDEASEGEVYSPEDEVSEGEVYSKEDEESEGEAYSSKDDAYVAATERQYKKTQETAS